MLRGIPINVVFVPIGGRVFGGDLDGHVRLAEDELADVVHTVREMPQVALRVCFQRVFGAVGVVEFRGAADEGPELVSDHYLRKKKVGG